MTDRLAEMLMMQLELQRRYYDKAPAALAGDARKDYIRTMVLATTDELHEALRNAPWKPWSKTNEWLFDEKIRFTDELVDAFHFFMNLMLVAEISAEELFVEYCRKNGVNHGRIDEGYISPTG